MALDPLTIIARWQAAVSAADFDALRALSTDDVEIVSPRGKFHGHGGAQRWVRQTGIGLQTMRAFLHGKHVVVEQTARWRVGPDSTEAPEQVIATHFTLHGDKVARAQRYETLDAALAAAGLPPVVPAASGR
ncbi:MAG TPA: nuclear transport factor 2 family protein [Candidatus Elarobacter sp.]